MRYLALALAALALAGCETTQEKSTKLEKAAKHEAAEAARRKTLAQRSLSITKPSTIVQVTVAVALHDSEGGAVAVTLHNSSASTLRNVPIQVTVVGAHSAKLYTNATPGLATALVSMPLLAAHATSTWVDDQAQIATTPSGVRTEIGEGEHVHETVPQITVEGAHLSENSAEGNVVNHSSIAQQELVVYALARHDGQIVAAGRAVVPQLATGATQHFQAFLIGSAKGAQLEVSAVPSTLG